MSAVEGRADVACQGAVRTVPSQEETFAEVKNLLSEGPESKVALRRHRKSERLCDSHEGLESTLLGHSSPLARTPAIRSRSGRSIAAIS